MATQGKIKILFRGFSWKDEGWEDMVDVLKTLNSLNSRIAGGGGGEEPLDKLGSAVLHDEL